MKKNISTNGFFLLCISIFLNIPLIYAHSDTRLVDSFDDDQEEWMLLEGLDNTAMSNTRNIVPVKSILGLIEDAGGFALLDQDFYLRTNPFVERNILDLPLWEMHSCQEPEKWIIGGHLFWNKMDRSVFKNKSTSIDCYLDLQQKTLFNALDNLSPELKDLFPMASLIDPLSDTADFDSILKLFRNFTAEQRRLGIMMHLWRQWEQAEFRAILPLYYVERNFIATPEEQEAIEAQFGTLTPDEAKMFEKNHGISDRIGFGDFRIESNYVPYNTDTFALRVGGFLTIPTAVAFSKGINGTTFRDCLEQPTLDLQALFDLACMDDDPSVSSGEQEALKEELIGDICKNKNGFLLGAVDRLNAVLVETSLGNRGHLGIGGIIRSKTSLRSLLDDYEWTDRINWNNRLSVEYLTPANETRFYIKRNSIEDFNSRDFNSDDEEVQDENLAFIEQEIVDKFYPYAIKTRVKPGPILRWFSRWCVNGDVWDLTLGSDIWIQAGESLKLKCVDPELFAKLDICNASNSLAYQFKSVASFGFKVLRPEYAFFFNINAEGTSWNKNIGDDWAVSLNLEANF
jgi:hypothetical protein